ncbi:hypothetical protein DY000_02047947 [Brassica cretica]|uniref:Uncharacterized protein n=1 Tax=Brassica cretica TaxID=69181 RepID=A0ABQ7EQ68_BRACR|nr:hypothetical protein DY000_02047947 [Brassica cretica]
MKNVSKVWVPYDISPCPDELTIGLEFATLMVGFTTVLLGFIVTSNTSPDSCVIDVKVGVVCDPVHSDSTTHDHSDAFIPPVSQVYPAYAETYKNHSRTSPIVLHLFQA